MSVILTVSIGWLVAGQMAYAAPPENKGKGHDKRDNPGQAVGREQQRDRNGQAQGGGVGGSRRDAATASAIERAQSVAARQQRERLHPHQERQALGASDHRHADGVSGGRMQLAQAMPQWSHGHHAGLTDQGPAAAMAQVQALSENLRKLERARWWFNPHDTRGQGNVGQPDMRDPYGFDKESGRQGRERGRPIRAVDQGETVVDEEPVSDGGFVADEEPTEEEPVVDGEDSGSEIPADTSLAEEPVVDQPASEEPVETPLADGEGEGGLVVESSLEGLVSVDFSSLEEYEDWLMTWFQNTVRQSNYESLPDYYKSETSYEEWYNMWYTHFFNRTDTYTGVIVNQRETMDYTLNIAEGGTYTITTELVTLEPYDSMHYQYDAATGTLLSTPVQYEEGEVILQQTQEVTFDDVNSTFTYSYDLPDEITGNEDLNTQLRVTVTDTSTGDSVTVSYDKAVYLYRCPYGIVYDQQTGEPIPGATVTVHNAGGSIAVLDRAANPNVTNPQTTDATGRYNCKLAIGKRYYLRVEAPGYAPYQSELFSERWHIVREDVGMTPSLMISSR